MQQIRVRSLLTLLCGLLTAPLHGAEGQFYVVPGLQNINFDNSTGLDTEWGPDIGFGYDLSERISLEFNTFDLDPDNKMNKGVDIDHWRFDILYDLGQSSGNVQPFVVGGLGHFNFAGENDTGFDFGAGIKVDLPGNFEWRTAVRTFTYFNRNTGDRDYGIDTGLVYYFGGTERPRPVETAATPQPAPAPAPVDSDRDGVPDDRDACPDTPRNYAVDERGCPIPAEEIARVELLVNFDFDRSEVKPEYFSEIERVAAFMSQYPDVIVELEGHTDSVGTDAYNLGLSDRRANAVRQVMIGQFNVQASHISAVGYGESQPVAGNDSSAGRAQNRRVITVIIKTLQNYRPR
ncbi:MAG: OmpA family protein [Proteobacteria bacterium]|nr:OmpA family protein [Pseudomonadota bacterium]